MIPYKAVRNKRIDYAALLCLLLPVMVSWYFYDRLPEKVPTHWNFHGEVDGWMSRNYMVFGFTQGVQIALYGLMIGLRWFMLQTTAGKTGAGAPGVRELKKREILHNSALLDNIMVLTIGFMGAVHLFLIFHAVYSVGIGVVTFFLLPLFLILVAWLSFTSIRKTGRIRHEMAAGGIISIELAEEGAQYWKWGIFYVNPGDKRVMVEKRIGIGFALNFAHAMSWVIMFLLILPLVLILGIVYFRQ